MLNDIDDILTKAFQELIDVFIDLCLYIVTARPRLGWNARAFFHGSKEKILASAAGQVKQHKFYLLFKRLRILYFA